jgi:hypothetical protein
VYVSKSRVVDHVRRVFLNDDEQTHELERNGGVRTCISPGRIRINPGYSYARHLSTVAVEADLMRDIECSWSSCASGSTLLPKQRYAPFTRSLLTKHPHEMLLRQASINHEIMHIVLTPSITLVNIFSP